MLSEKAKSRAQQRFFGMVRAAQKGEMDNPSSEVLDAADSMKVDDVKKFAKTKHKGLPEKKKEVVTEADKKGKGSGKKDACYKKVKASAKVWPSAYASGRLVQCRKKGAANYGNSKSESYSWRDDFEFIEEGAAWQRKAGKNSKGGLNEKGRKSYEAQNPGSDLKAPVTGKVKPGGKAAKRRKSFCARMGGMKGPMKKPNGKPTRKALALRKWKCRKKS